MAESLPTTALTAGSPTRCQYNFIVTAASTRSYTLLSMPTAMGKQIRCYSVAAVTPGVSPVAVKGLKETRHDDVMSTCFHMRRRGEPLNANDVGALS
jgi:hypothetical protein